MANLEVFTLVFIAVGFMSHSGFSRVFIRCLFLGSLIHLSIHLLGCHVLILDGN